MLTINSIITLKLKSEFKYPFYFIFYHLSSYRNYPGGGGAIVLPPGGNYPGGNSPGGNPPGGSLLGGNIPGGNYPG